MGSGFLKFPFLSFEWAAAGQTVAALSTSDTREGFGRDMIRGYQKMQAFASLHIGLKECPIGSNDGALLREVLKGTQFEGGSEWCGFWVQRIWIEGGVLGDATSAWWLDGGSAHLTLAVAKIHDKVLSYPASGCMALLCHADGKPFHYVWVETISPDGQTVGTIEGNTNEDGSPTGYEVCRHTRRVADLIFIQP